MQTSFTFARDKRLPEILDRLDRAWPSPARPNTDPLSQLVFMVMASDTPTAMALAAFQRLRGKFRNWGALRDAEPDLLLGVLRGVAHAHDKAISLPRIMQAIETKHGVLELDFLAEWNGAEALDWLCTLPHVDATIAAATLSFSSLRKTVATVDTETARPIRRLGLAPEGAAISALDRHLIDRIPTEWKAGELTRLHQGFARLAARLCHRGRPDCKHCPLSDLCPTAAQRSATILSFPAGSARPARKDDGGA